MLLEANFGLHQLMPVDHAEAIGNLENAVNAKLNAFHNLYDLMRQEGVSSPNWYEVPELCVVLAIRNARHHNKANRIRSLYNYHRYVAADPRTAEDYFYVDFPAPPEEEGGDCFDVPLSWADLDDFLSLPRAESRLRSTARGLVREYLGADSFEAAANTANMTRERVFFNFVPLALNAGIALLPAVKNLVNPDSVEANFFLYHFETVGAAQTRDHETAVIPMRIPE